MAPHSSTLAWKIPWMEEPGRLQSMGSLRVGHDWESSLSLFTFMHWRRKWQPTPVFLPRESQEWGSLVGCRLWGHTELDMTEWLCCLLVSLHVTWWLHSSYHFFPSIFFSLLTILRELVWFRLYNESAHPLPIGNPAHGSMADHTWRQCQHTH